jgi:TetR/AcrR family transcriptional regulator, repressor for uid operon
LKGAAALTQKSENKGDIRRRQVIDAAAECFRKEGFHGTSIARISQAAGMSPGHIYHYFANKELIVEAIVDQEESDFAELLRLLHDQGKDEDLVTTISIQMDKIIDRLLDAKRRSLMLEIAAEATRNARVAHMLEESDRRMGEQFAKVAAEKGGKAIAERQDPDARARLEMLPLLFSGLALRSVYNPTLDRRRIGELMKEALVVLWRPDR